jgi:hypothetical protein
VSALRDRPRVTAVLFVALVGLVAVAMLAGAALAGGDNNCATASDGGLHAQLKR